MACIRLTIVTVVEKLEADDGTRLSEDIVERSADVAIELVAKANPVARPIESAKRIARTTENLTRLFSTCRISKYYQSGKYTQIGYDYNDA